MPVTASEYAAWANAAYEKEKNDVSRSPLQEFEEYGGLDAEKKKKGKWEVLETTVEYLVVKKIETGEVVVAIKGSSNTGDFASSDVLILAGGLAMDPRLDPLRNTVRKYRRQGFVVSVTGHSLGGSLAAELAKTEDVLGVVFNMGSGAGEISPSSIAGDTYRGARTDNVIHFHLKLDVVSTASTWMDRYTTFYIDSGIDPTKAHFMHNFGAMKDELYQKKIDSQSAMVKKHQDESGEEISGDVTLTEKATRNTEAIGEIMGTLVAVSGFLKGLKSAGVSSFVIQKLTSALNAMRGVVGRVADGLRIGGDAVQGLVEELGTKTGQIVRYIKSLSSDISARFRSTSKVEGGYEDEFDAYSEEGGFRGREMDWMDEYANGTGQYGSVDTGPVEVEEKFNFDMLKGEEGVEPEIFDGLSSGMRSGDLQPVDLDIPDVGEGVGLLGEGGGASVVEGGEVAEGVLGEGIVLSAELVGAGMSMLASFVISGLGVLGVIVGVGILIYQIIHGPGPTDEDRYNAAVRDYDAQLSRSAETAKVQLKTPIARRVTTVTGRGLYTGQPYTYSFTWKNMDLLGMCVMPYLQWRAKYPEVSFTPKGDTYTSYDKDPLVAIMNIASDMHPGIPFVYNKSGWLSSKTLELIKDTKDFLEFKKTLPADLTRSDFSVRDNDDDYIPLSFYEYGKVYGLYSKFLQEKYYKKFNDDYKDWLRETHTIHNFSELSTDDQQKVVNGELGKFDDATRVSIQSALQLYAHYTQVVQDMSTYATARLSSFPAMGLGKVKQSLESFRSQLISMIRTDDSKGGKGVNWLLGSMVVMDKGYQTVLGDAVLMINLLNRGVDLGHYQTYIKIGESRYFIDPVTTVDDYNTKKGLMDKELAKGNLEYDEYIAQGNKPVGDRETQEEFSDRFKSWQQRQIQAKYMKASVDTPFPHDPNDVWMSTHNMGKIPVGKRNVLPPVTWDDLAVKVDQNGVVTGTPTQPAQVSESADSGAYIGTDGVTQCRLPKKKKWLQEPETYVDDWKSKKQSSLVPRQNWWSDPPKQNSGFVSPGVHVYNGPGT